MKNAVIYARYSSDKQNEMSIEGQIEEGVTSARIVNRLKQREDELEELNKQLQNEKLRFIFLPATR